MTQGRSKLIWTLVLFFFSGATSLVYEVLWTRRLSLTFGHTVLAVSTVLTVFMSGLALGSFLAGRWTDKERRRLEESEAQSGPARFLALYGKLEIGIGVWAALTLILLNWVEAFYLSAARGGAETSTLHGIVFLGSFLVLLPPTTAMGATLPVFTQLLVATKQDVGAWLSRIYGWNTLGACCGAGLGGFVLLPTLGLRMSVLTAAVGNLAIGITALSFARKLSLGSEGSSAREDSEAQESQAESAESDEASQGAGWVLPAAFGFSGFAAMVYQLGWTRGLVLSIGSSTYSFAIILTAFLASLGLGSLVYKRVMLGRTPRVMHLAYLQFGIAIFGLLATVLIGTLPQVMIRVIPALNFEFVKILLFDFTVCVALMALPTLAMGLTFPLVTHLYTDRLSSLGKRLGEAYAANTLGAIVGSFLGGFILIPQFGAQTALLGAVVLNLVLGAILALLDKGPKLAAGLLFAVGSLAVVFSPTWDPTELSAGAGIYAKSENFLFVPAFYKDGLSATVTVGFNGPHSPYLKVNGKTDASVGLQDMAHQVLLGLLPVSLHKNPSKVALIGLGSGVTTAVLADTDSVTEIQCSELEPAIVEVQKYFAPYTEHILENPKLSMSVTDGRTFILGSPGKYDLIISQPSNPWIAGIGNLYTEDFYRACVEQLEPNGLMCQWFQLYSVSEYDLQLVLNTFFTVFPEGMIFQTGPGDVLLVGAQQEVDFDSQRLDKLWNEEKLTFWSQMIGLLQPEYVLGTFVATRAQVMEVFLAGQEGAPLNTDDKPLLEFQAPRSLYLKSEEVASFPDSFPDLVPQQYSSDPNAVGLALLGRFQLSRFIGLEKRVGEGLESQTPWAPLAGALLAQRTGDFVSSDGLLRAVNPERASSAPAQILLGDMRVRAEQWELAALHYENALQDPPVGAEYLTLMKLANCATQMGALEQAVAAYRKASTLSARPDPFFYLGHLSFLLDGNPEESLAYFEEALKRDPYNYSSLFRGAYMHAQLGNIEKAIEYSTLSYQLFREDRQNIELLSQLLAQVGRIQESQELQAEAAELKLREVEAERARQ